MSDNDPGAGNLCFNVFSMHCAVFAAKVGSFPRCTYD